MAALTNRYEDDDASHLPPGMKRVGYDTDTERYTFREGDDLWLGEPGSLYGGRLKWAGRAPGAASRNHEEGGDNEGRSNDKSNSTRRTGSKTPPSSRQSLKEHARNALSKSSTSSVREDESDWGVPVVSISETGAAPPDRPSDETGLKRRATRLKEVAVSTADAIGVVGGWTRKRGYSRAVQERPSSRTRRP